MRDKKIIKDGREYINGHEDGEVNNLINGRLRLIYLSSEIISKDAVNIFNQNPVDILNDLSIIAHPRLQKVYANSNYILEFGQNVDPKIWVSLLNDILDYRKRFTQMASELINRGVIADTKKLTVQYAK